MLLAWAKSYRVREAGSEYRQRPIFLLNPEAHILLGYRIRGQEFQPRDIWWIPWMRRTEGELGRCGGLLRDRGLDGSVGRTESQHLGLVLLCLFVSPQDELMECSSKQERSW